MNRMYYAVPRLCRNLVKRQITASPRLALVSNRRLYHDGPRWLPVLSRRGFGFPSPSNMLRMMDDHFRDMQRIMDEFMPLRYEYPRSSRDMQVKHNKKEFEVTIDIGNDYSPEEIQVKVVDDVVEIQGKHTRKSEDTKSSFSSQFSRQFKLPEDVEPDSIECSWTSEGSLVIRGHVTGSENVKERIVNISKEATEKKD